MFLRRRGGALEGRCVEGSEVDQLRWLLLFIQADISSQPSERAHNYSRRRQQIHRHAL